jgi:hypothetical protein
MRGVWLACGVGAVTVLAVTAMGACGSAFTSSGSDGGDAGDAADAGPIDTGGDVVIPDAFEEPPATCVGSFQCVPVVPDGWQGPFQLYTGPDAAPGCSANFFSTPSFQGGDVILHDDAQCTCDCPSQGVGCQGPSIDYHTQSDCSDPTCHSQMVSSTCTPSDTTGCMVAANFYFSSGSPTPTGTCTPDAGTTVPPVRWMNTMQACVTTVTPQQSSCPSGQVCQPASPAPYLGKLCIEQDGTPPCPSPYPDGHVFYTGVTDMRGCTDCTCGPLAGVSCTTTFDLYSDPACPSGAQTTLPAPVTCDGLPALGAFVENDNMQNDDAGCAPSGGTPMGTETPGSQVTFCCAQ